MRSSFDHIIQINFRYVLLTSPYAEDMSNVAYLFSDQRNNLGQHCVHLATMGGHVPFLQFLNWNGADMNALEGRSGRSSLHLAVGARSLPLVTCLVEPKPSGCGVDASLLDWYGRTPYQLSLMNGQSEIAAFLRSRTPGADSWTNEPTASDSEEEFLAQTAARLVNV